RPTRGRGRGLVAGGVTLAVLVAAVLVLLLLSGEQGGKTNANGTAVTGRTGGTTVPPGSLDGWQLTPLPGPHPGQARAVAFSPDGKKLAVAFYERVGAPAQPALVRIWDVERKNWWTALKRHESQVRALAFSPDSNTLAYGTGNPDEGPQLPEPGKVFL